MSEERFTKQEASHVIDAVNDLFKAIPKKKNMDYIGHFNDIFLFLEAAARVAPKGKEKI